MISIYKKKIYQLRLKYGLYAALAGLIFCVIATAYAMLDAKYNFSKVLTFKIEEKILGNHKFIFPSMTSTVFSSCLIFLIVVGGWIASYQIYHKYKYKAEYLDQLSLHEKDSSNPKPEEKRISKKNLLIGCLIIFGHNLLSFMNDELSVAFQKAISEKVDLFFWLSYAVILVIVFVTNTLDVVQADAISGRLALVAKKAVKEKEDSKKTSLKERFLNMNWKFILAKYGVFAVVSLIIVAFSFGFAAWSKNCDWINFDLPAIMIGENKINWFTNQQNTFFLILMPILLFVLTYNYVLPILEKKFKNKDKNDEEVDLAPQKKKTIGNHCSDLGKAVGLSVLSAFSIDISINVTNSLQELKVENGAYALCLVMIFVVNVISAYCFVKQYIDSPKLNYEKLEYEGNGLGCGKLAVV